MDNIMASKINAPKMKQKHPNKKSAPGEGADKPESPTPTKASNDIKVELNPNDWDFYQVTALSSVPIEDDGYTICHDSAKHINANGNAWRNKDLLDYHKTYLGGHAFREHEQDPDKSYGIILDVRLRKINNKKSNTFRYTAEVLYAINRTKSPDNNMVKKFAEDGIFSTSMGCSSNSVTCSVCGNVSTTDYDMCSHVAFNYGKQYITKYGSKSRMANLVTPEDKSGIPKYDENDLDTYPVSFYELSIVEDPAYKGAVPSHKFTIPDNMLIDNKVIVQMPKVAYDRSIWNALKHWSKKGQLTIRDTNGTKLS